MSNVDSFIKHYNLVIDNSNSSDEKLYIRSSIRSEDQALNFVKKLSRETDTHWEPHYGFWDTDTKRFVYCKSWVCPDLDSKLDKKQGASTSLTTSVKMEILLKDINYSTKRKDTFLLNDPPLACIIRLNLNYHCKCKVYSRHIKVQDDVKKLFFKYFDKGFSTTQAKKAFIENRQRTADFKMKDFLPSKTRLSYLYAIWREEKFVKKSVKDKNSKGQPKCDMVHPLVGEDHIYSKNSICSCGAEVPFGSSDLFDVKTLISAIPRKNPPLRRRKRKRNDDIVLDSQSDNSDEMSHLLSDDEALSSSPVAAVKEPDILQENDYVNKILPDSNSPSVHVQRQDISVNKSPSHLNGAVIMVNSTNVSSTYPDDSSTVSMKGNFVFKDLNFAVKSNISNMQISSPNLSNVPSVYISTADTSSYPSNLLSTRFTRSILKKEPVFFERNQKGDLLIKKDVLNPSTLPVTTSKQIHITSTALQSGAQVSMAPVCQSSQAVDTIYFSECQSNVPSLDKPVKIKEEPKDPSEIIGLEQSEDPNMPVISTVFSLNEKNGIKEGSLSVSDIKVENSDNGHSETIPMDFLISNAPEDLIVDEDQQFLLSLLPKLRQVPDVLKQKLKSDIKNLITTATIEANTGEIKVEVCDT